MRRKLLHFIAALIGAILIGVLLGVLTNKMVMSSSEQEPMTSPELPRQYHALQNLRYAGIDADIPHCWYATCCFQSSSEEQAASLGNQRQDRQEEPIETPTHLIMEATAYTAGFESTGKRPGDPGYGITTSELLADRGGISVDPAVIPLGTPMWVEGYGYGIAIDTGGDIKGNRIDVFFHDVNRALEWGRRRVEVRLFVAPDGG